jgi:hypothetical protein
MEDAQEVRGFQKEAVVNDIKMLRRTKKTRSLDVPRGRSVSVICVGGLEGGKVTLKEVQKDLSQPHSRGATFILSPLSLPIQLFAFLP